MTAPTLDIGIGTDGITVTGSIDRATIAGWSPERYMALMEAMGALADVVLSPAHETAEPWEPPPISLSDIRAQDPAEVVPRSLKGGELPPGREPLVDHGKATVETPMEVALDRDDAENERLVELLEACMEGGEVRNDRGFVLRDLAPMLGITQTEAAAVVERAEDMKAVTTERESRKLHAVLITDEGRGFVAAWHGRVAALARVGATVPDA